MSACGLNRRFAQPAASAQGQLGKPLSIADWNKDFTVKLPGKAVVLFWRPGCGHCDSTKPAYSEAVKSNVNPNVQFYNVNTSENQQLTDLFDAQESPFAVNGVPMIVGYNNGRFFSIYDSDRSPESFKIFGEGIGLADVTFYNQ